MLQSKRMSDDFAESQSTSQIDPADGILEANNEHHTVKSCDLADEVNPPANNNKESMKNKNEGSSSTE
jgi:hypothetical protein